MNKQYKLIPIRYEDQHAIRQWRNEQIAILRQKEELTEEKQAWYFKNVVDALFEQDKPGQILFSFLENDQLIGYGGLVHIDWESRNAEVSFLTETKRNSDAKLFISDWCNYLEILKKLAKQELGFSKIYTYAYDIRPNLYTALDSSGFIEEARLKDHVVIDNEAKDVLIHSCFLDKLVFRFANQNDMMLYYHWANDEVVRANSYVQKEININEHKAWFEKKIEECVCAFYLFIMEGVAAGQVRIDVGNDETVIGISVDKNYRGKGLAVQMLKQACNHYLKTHPHQTIVAYIKESNIASYKSFELAGFKEPQKIMINNEKSFKLIRN